MQAVWAGCREFICPSDSRETLAPARASLVLLQASDSLPRLLVTPTRKRQHLPKARKQAKCAFSNSDKPRMPQSSEYPLADKTSPTRATTPVPDTSKSISLTDHSQVLGEPHLQSHEEGCYRENVLLRRFSKCGPQTSSIGICWERGRMAGSQPHPRTPESEALLVRPESHCNKPSGLEPLCYLSPIPKFSHSNPEGAS